MLLGRDTWEELVLAEQVRAGRVVRGLHWAARWIARAPLVVLSDSLWAPVPEAVLAEELPFVCGLWRGDRRRAEASGATWYDCDDATDTLVRRLRRSLAGLLVQDPRDPPAVVLPAAPAVARLSYRRGPGWHAALILVLVGADGRLRLAVAEPQEGRLVALTDREWRSIRAVVL